MSKKNIFFGLIIALFLAVAISPFASPWPDGLEKVAEKLGFLELGEAAPKIESPIPDYAMPGVKHEGTATALAGAAGTLIVFGLSYATASFIRRRKN